jgi:hypothetical protein
MVFFLFVLFQWKWETAVVGMAFLVFLLFTRYLVSGALSINMTSTYDAMHVLSFTICFAHIKSCVCTNKFDSEVGSFVLLLKWLLSM